MKALTLNNMGCTLMKEKRPNEALEYLSQTLEIEIVNDYSKAQIAQTCLNLTFTLSKMGKH
jgi:Tfp pilus assembly protein PilF